MKTLDIKPKPYFLVTWEKIDAWASHQKLPLTHVDQLY